MRDIRGILISKWQIECFLEKLVSRYQGWEIEDIFNVLINKDINEFEEFVIGEYGNIKELEAEIVELKERLETVDEEYMVTIREQETRLAVLGHRNMIVADRAKLLKMRDEVEGEEVDPIISDINVGATE